MLIIARRTWLWQTARGVLLTLAATSALSAQQNQPSAAPSLSALLATLQLSDSQRTHIEHVRQRYAVQQNALRAQQQALRTQLAAARNARETARVQQLSSEMASLAARRRTFRVREIQELRALLTPEQQVAFDRWSEAERASARRAVRSTQDSSTRARTRRPPPPPITWVIIAVCLGIPLGYAIRNKLRAKRRREALRDFALQAGFSFNPDKQTLDAMISRIATEDEPELPFLDDDNHVRNVLQRDASGSTLQLFEYCYLHDRYGGDARFETIALFRTDTASLPTFRLYPEGWLEKILDKVGLHDIDFDTDPDFSARWNLKGDDEAAVRAFFSAELRSFFQNMQATDELVVRGSGQWLVVSRYHRLIPVEQMSDFANQARLIASRLLEPDASGD
jgi:Spy/CpxP family protein refolding chaperone